MKVITGYLVAGLMFFGATTCLAADAIVTAGDMGGTFLLDGKADEWGSVPATTVKINAANDNDAKNYTGAIDVSIKAAMVGDDIAFLVEWPDDTRDDTHKTLAWDKEKDGYVEGKDREDRLILKFDMGGDFTTCMLSGKEYKADIWHWKAYRSGAAGLAHDKMHVMSTGKLPKAKKHPARGGGEIWIQRPSDKGGKLYKSQRPIDNIGDSIPRYLPNKKVSGSVADVKAAATHDGGKWTLEMRRKLDTGNPDDVKFAGGQSVKSGVAIFNHTGDDHHSVGGFVLEIK